MKTVLVILAGFFFGQSALASCTYILSNLTSPKFCVNGEVHTCLYTTKGKRVKKGKNVTNTVECTSWFLENKAVVTQKFRNGHEVSMSITVNGRTQRCTKVNKAGFGFWGSDCKKPEDRHSNIDVPQPTGVL